MLKKFASWFICFGLSFLVERFGWTEQGKAFLYIRLAVSGLIIAVLILICLFGGNGLGERIGIPFATILIYALLVGIVLFATWGATQLFDINFYVAYQIMTFGQCLCSSSEKKDN